MSDAPSTHDLSDALEEVVQHRVGQLSKTTTRVQLELARQSYARLSALKDKTEATSYAEVLKNALRLYESLIEQHEAGRRLFTRGPDGVMVEYKVF